MAVQIAPSLQQTPQPSRRRGLDLAVCVVLFFLVLLAYLRTMRPTFGWGDSSELITAAYYLGVGHSPGYPTWMLIAYPFAHLPMGDVAFRVNFMTALLGALGVSLLYLVYRIISGSRVAAFIAALTFAFSATFWDQTTEAEVYTLHVCLAAVILLITLAWRKTRRDHLLYVLSWMVGLSLGNHALTALMVPALFYLVWAERGWRFFTWRRVLACVGFFLLGISVYAYLPIRALANPPPHLNNPHSLADMWDQLTAPGAREVMFDRGLMVPLVRAWNNLWRLRFEFGYGGCALALVGLGLLLWRDRALAIFLFLIAFLDIAYSVNFSIFDIYVYYLPLHLVCAALIARGAAGALALGASMLGRLPRAGLFARPGWRTAPAAVLLMLLPFTLFSDHLRWVDGSKEYGPERFARAVFRQVEPGAMILADWWTIAPLGYLKHIERERSDVVMFAGPSIYSDKGFVDFAQEDFLRRYPAVYFVEMLTYRANLVRERWWLVPQGPVARVLMDRPDPKTLLAAIPPTPIARFDDHIALVWADIAPGPLRPGQVLDFTLYWTPLPAYPARPYEAIFVLKNRNRDRIWQESNLLGHDLYPLDQWRPGQVLREDHRIYLPDPVPPGEYDLLVRLRERGQASCLACDRPLHARDPRDYRIARIMVAQPEPLSTRHRIPDLIALLRP